MKKGNRWCASILLFLIFVGIIIVSNNISNSLKVSDSDKYLSMRIATDEHVVPYEKVYVNLDNNVKKMSKVSLVVGNDKFSFKTDLLDLNDKPYFELPYYNDNVVIGLKYYIKEAVINYADGSIIRYTSNRNDSFYLNIDETESYFIVDEVNDNIDAWRGFKGIDFSNYSYSNGNIYFKMYGDTSDMVDVILDFVRTDERKSFKADVEGFGNRLFFNISDEKVEAGEEYYLKSMTIYYNNGGSYYYNADNYANILSNRIIITAMDNDKSFNIEEPSEDRNDDFLSTERTHDIAGGIVVLFLLIIGAFAIVFFLKDEN